MGIDSGNNAEKAIAMELKHLNKKLDRLIDILDKRDVVLKIDNGGITMEPRKMRHTDRTAIEPIEDEKSGAMEPDWHAAADRYVSYIDNGPGKIEES